MSSGETATKWVFGYGSLCWLPGFDFDTSVPGHVKGFARRFWQGNTTHRGTPGKVNELAITSCKFITRSARNPTFISEVILLTQLGRVATLINDPDSASYGMAFRLKDTTAASALEYLNMRESK